MFLIVTPTYHRNEKYCNLLIDLVDKTWPGHPEIWFFTDGKNIRSPNVVRIESKSWAAVLVEGLRRLKDKYANLKYVYLILEDLYPLWQCSSKDLDEIQEIVIQNNLKCVSFVTFDNWRKVNDVQMGGRTFYKIPKDFWFYSQLQPAIWELGHLIETCEYAIRHDMRDPWGFEVIVGNENHYVSDYRWPSVLNGFLVQRRVNPNAIWKIKVPEGGGLRNLLLREYITQIPGNALLFMKYKIKNLFRRLGYK